jgi:hypothetical protein
MNVVFCALGALGALAVLESPEMNTEKRPVPSDLRTGLIQTGKTGEPNVILPILPHPV